MEDIHHPQWDVFDIKKFKINFKFLIALTTCMSLSSMNFGIGLASNQTVCSILSKKLDWSTSDQTFNTTLIQSCSIIGIGLGSCLGGNMLGNGKKRVLFIYNIIALLSSASSLYLNFYLICASRLIHGFATGILVCAAPKMIEETVPSHVMDYGFGTSTNLCINVAIMIELLLGIGLPPEEDFYDTNYWMVFYAFAVPLLCFALFFNMTYFKNDSIVFLAKQGKKQECLEVIKKVFNESDKNCEIIYLFYVRE
jgi:MFS family permease